MERVTIENISVPQNAADGTYQGGVYNGSCQYTSPDGSYTGEGWRTSTFYFEVVCMTVKLSVTEISRTETVYRLSCVAEAQGGTGNYSYDWSSTVDGSSAVSGLGTPNLVIEVPVGGIGQIGVSVEDDGTPKCSDSDSFLTCQLTCDFSTALISTPAPPATSPYVYECQASVQSDPLYPPSYEWSPAPTSTLEDGRIARFEFSDDEEHSINLTVIRPDNCRAFKTKKVGGYEFVVSTNPAGSGAGSATGTRNAMQFTVGIEATATGRFVGPPPAQLTFELTRPATNTTTTIMGTLVTGSNPPRYWALWNVTQQKGRWQVKVQGYKSNTAPFKINKREQIVQVAGSWVGATAAQIGGNCNNLTSTVYGHLGLGQLNLTSTDTQLDEAATICAGDGCLLFYSRLNAPPGDVAHVAIASGGQRININSITVQGEPVVPEDVDAGIPESYKEQIESRSTVNLDED